jgi:hypothetical protein
MGFSAAMAIPPTKRTQIPTTNQNHNHLLFVIFRPPLFFIFPKPQIAYPYLPAQIERETKIPKAH